MFLSLDFITDFGDGAVTGATAIVTAALFFLTRNRPAAVAMMLALGISVLLIAVTKIALYTYVFLPSYLNLRSPSGHTAVPMAVYGVLVHILVAPLKKRTRVLAYILTTLFVVSIAASRVMLGRHSLSDVICGFIIGAIVCLAIARIWLSQSPAKINRWVLVTVTLATMALVHGIRLPAEPFIEDIAAHLEQ